MKAQALQREFAYDDIRLPELNPQEPGADSEVGITIPEADTIRSIRFAFPACSRRFIYVDRSETRSASLPT